VRVLGSDLVTVHVRLMLDGSTALAEASAQQERQLLIDDRIAAPVAGLHARQPGTR
jgi:hypothetical protein